jgi:hypothetical protein
VKLHATMEQVDHATALGGFEVDTDGRVHVPAVVVEPAFLNSEPFKLRLIFNALTSPRVFLGGDVARYRRDHARADRSLALLALALLRNSCAGRVFGAWLVGRTSPPTCGLCGRR